ncbi:hypothetical protein BpHYR1_022348 [Brachionus plicatilis]|uniref:Uncharacterized protein n=1 Tax=Brachionus plicatilis TaxID=10195 RepID=A0A3M7T2R4_BRAPC|nr:hypothetical protein BpHYR1_022348 [Brachionus plicatilis]
MPLVNEIITVVKVQQSMLHFVVEEFLFNLYLNFRIPHFTTLFNTFFASFHVKLHNLIKISIFFLTKDDSKINKTLYALKNDSKMKN